MVPLEQPVGDGMLRVLSMGFLADEDSAIMWRGLILNRAVQQFLEDVHWGDLDYLLVDMPPGTGDIQMGLARMLPRTEVLVVTTPPEAAQKVAARAADMARRGHLRVAGVIENMSDFTCAHGERYALFGTGGGRRLADQLGVELIGSVPLHPSVAGGGDAGRPVALEDANEIAAVFAAIAERIATDLAPAVPMDTCSARLLERVEAAVDAGTAPERRRLKADRAQAAPGGGRGRPVLDGLPVARVTGPQHDDAAVLDQDDRFHGDHVGDPGRPRHDVGHGGEAGQRGQVGDGRRHQHELAGLPRARASCGPDPGAGDGLTVVVDGQLTGRRRRHEEPGVVAPRCLLGGDPVADEVYAAHVEDEVLVRQMSRNPIRPPLRSAR